MFHKNPVQIAAELKLKKDEIEAAELAATDAPFRTYDVTQSLQNKDGARFFMVGCQGNAKKTQDEVAALMEWLAANPEHTPDFILILGDNAYDSGINAANDAQLQETFNKIYLKYPHLKKLPYFVISGNHDLNFHRARIPGQEKGRKHLAHEIAASYLGEKDTAYPTVESKKALYAQSELDLRKLPAFNMPSEAYSLIAGNTQIFCINSSSYAKDFFRLYEGAILGVKIQHQEAKKKYLHFKNLVSTTLSSAQDTLQDMTDRKNEMAEYDKIIQQLKAQRAASKNYEKNQAAWLETEVKKAKDAGRRVFLASHHALVTVGGRAYHSDSSIYLSNTKIDKKSSDKRTWHEKIYDFFSFKHKHSYNTILKECMKEQGLVFDGVFAAHDHSNYYYNNTVDREGNPTETAYPIRQIVAGGGGGGLQARVQFTDQKRMGCFLKRHGFTEIICDDKKPANDFDFNIHTIKNSKARPYERFEFNNTTLAAKRTYPENLTDTEKKQIEKLCATVMKAIDAYLLFIGTKQDKREGKYLTLNPMHGNLTHRKEGIDRAHQLWAYLIRENADNYEKTVDNIYKLVTWNSKVTSPTQHSLISIVNREIQNVYKKSLDALHSDALSEQFEILTTVKIDESRIPDKNVLSENMYGKKFLAEGNQKPGKKVEIEMQERHQAIENSKPQEQAQKETLPESKEVVFSKLIPDAEEPVLNAGQPKPAPTTKGTNKYIGKFFTPTHTEDKHTPPKEKILSPNKKKK